MHSDKCFKHVWTHPNVYLQKKVQNLKKSKLFLFFKFWSFPPESIHSDKCQKNWTSEKISKYLEFSDIYLKVCTQIMFQKCLNTPNHVFKTSQRIPSDRDSGTTLSIRAHHIWVYTLKKSQLFFENKIFFSCDFLSVYFQINVSNMFEHTPAYTFRSKTQS